jgi:hypothetical protein
VFSEKNKELCEWLTQMESKVSQNGDILIEDMIEKLKKVEVTLPPCFLPFFPMPRLTLDQCRRWPNSQCLFFSGALYLKIFNFPMQNRLAWKGLLYTQNIEMFSLWGNRFYAT